MFRRTMQCIWIVTCFLFGFSLQVDQVLAGGLSKCADFQYKLNGDSNCRNCPACPAGQMYTQNCGYTEINGVIRKTYKECKECPANQYKTSRSPFECDSCTYKCPEGKEMIHPCNRTHDLKCAKCKKGFYTASDGSCMRCSPCCGKPSIFSLYTEKECENAGMKDCSCRPLRNCVDKRGSCKKAFIKLSTTTYSRKTSFSPTSATNKTYGSYTTHKFNSSGISSTPVRTKPSTKKQTQENESKGEEKEQSFATGWLVAIVIGIVLVTTVLFHMLKYFNILKKIKVFLKPHQEDINDPTHSVITVEERFESRAVPAFTNYAQKMSPEEENENRSDHAQHLALLSRPNGSSSEFDHNEFDDDDPWVYRDMAQQSIPIRWPLTKAEVTLNPGYGEYVEILHREEPGDDCLSTQGNNSGSLLQLDESASLEVINEEPQTEENDEKQAVKVDMNKKGGEEQSDNEDPPTSIPATASGEKTMVIATGQHRGAMSDELIRNEFTKGKRDKSSSGKRRKKLSDIKRSKRKPLDIYRMESHDTFQCTCGDCSYRPYVRDKQLCHCAVCVPQPEDALYNILERRCLRQEICKELNKKGVSNWKDLCTYIRIDKDITSIEQEENPANIVIDKLKTSRPRLNLEDFNLILTRIKRQDIMEIIMRHHIKCILCRRNSFDDSLMDNNSASDPNACIASTS